VKGLARILAEHEPALTADFQREYGLRLVEAIRTRTLAEIEDLIVWLPKESAFRASFSPGDSAQNWSWSDSEELLLLLANMVSVQTHVVQQVNSPKKLPKPDLIQSPRTQGQKPSRADADNQARAMLAAIKRRKAM